MLKTEQELIEELFTRGFHTSIGTIYTYQPKPRYEVKVSQIVRIGRPKDYGENADSILEALHKIISTMK